MTKPLIVTSPLAAALAELTKNAALPASAIAREHPELIGTFRTATIKSFEYAFELGIRLLRGRLEIMSSAPAEIEQMEFKRLVRTAAEKGLIVNAGHGINYDNVRPLLGIKGWNEFNIGHSIISRALFVGLENAVRDMVRLLKPDSR